MLTSIRYNMIAEDSLGATFDRAARLGFDGIECPPIGDDRWDELLQAVRHSGVKPALLSPGAGSPMHAEAAQRRAWFESARRTLDRAAEVGATGFIVVPTLPNKMGGQPRIGDLWPYQSQVEAEQNVFVEMVHRLGEGAPDGTFVVIECLNRYEQFWPLALSEGVALCRRADTPRVGILADFFHMNIEEADIAQSIREAADWIVHVHLADSHRRQPGTGHTDFRPGLQALVEADYQRYLGFEYSTKGDADEDMRGALAHIQELLAALPGR